MRGNLLLHKRPPNANETNATAAAYYKPLILLESAGDGAGRIWQFQNMVIENNTFYTPFVHHSYPITTGGGGGAGFAGERKMIGNIWSRGVGGSNGVSANAPEDGGFALVGKFPGTSTGGIWGKQIILGGRQDAFASGTVWTGCPSTSVCLTSTSQTPDWRTVFVNPAGGDFSVKEGSWGKRALNGIDLGADPAQLAQIRGLTVVPDSRSVELRWSVTDPIAHIPCIVEVHTAPDFESGQYAGELSDIRTYYGHDIDNANRAWVIGNQRTIKVGDFVPLAGGTPYYYRLHCGGDVQRGMFVTR
jgi:hypothetical protein